MKKLRILVTGASGNLGRCMILYLSKFNFTVYAADANADLLAAPETAGRFLLPRADDRTYIEKLNDILLHHKIDLVLFESDLEIRNASQHIQQIKARCWYPEFAAVKKMQDKYYCNQVWKKQGLPVPESAIILRKQQLRDNVWIRPLHYIGGGGKHAFHATTQIEAIKFITHHNGWGKFTMSEFLPGKMYGFDSLWKEGILLGFSVKERVRYKANFETQGFTTSLVRTTNNDVVQKTACAAICAVQKKPDGVYSVDLRENERGIPCLTEINPGRFLTTSLLLFKELNYDLPMDYINCVLGRKINKRTLIDQNKYLYFIPGLVRVIDEIDLDIENAGRYFE